MSNRIPQMRSELVRAAARRYPAEAAAGLTTARVGRRVRHAHPRRWFALAGTVAAAAVAATVLFGFQGGGFAPTSAVAAMDGLAHIAAGQSWPGVPGPGEYFYTESTKFSRSYVTPLAHGNFAFRDYPVTSGPQCAVDQMTHLQQWMAANGSGAETYTGYDYRFSSPAAKAACAAIGVTDPHVPSSGVPDSKIEQPHTEFFPARQRTYSPGLGELPFGGNDWKTLSSDPATLLKQLQKRDHGFTTDDTPAGEFNAVADFMSESDAPPSVRSHVFEAAKLIQGIKLLGTRTDPTGQTGIAVAIDHIYGKAQSVNGVGEELIFDPHTARLLDTEFISKNGKIVSWQSYKQPTLVRDAPANTTTG